MSNVQTKIPTTKLVLWEIGFKIQTLMNVLKHGEKFNVGLLEGLRIVFATTRVTMGRRYVSKIVHSKDYDKVYLKNFKDPIYYPKGASYYDLYLILGENFSPINWHNYNKKWTRLEKDDIVLDCGAAVGTFSLQAANKCKKVYAVEPLPKFIKALKMTFKNYKNVQILPVAVGDKEGDLYINELSFGSFLSNDKKGDKVQLKTIDSLFADKNRPITYIKADLEGYEMSMLGGAKKTLKKYKPKLAITVYHKENNYKKMISFLKKVNPDYNFVIKGCGNKYPKPIMLHAWIEKN